MIRLYFPKRNDLLKIKHFSFTPNDLTAFIKASEELEERARELTMKYLKSPTSITQRDVTDLAVDTYRQTIIMFDKKIAMGEKLCNEEQDIYDLCKRETEDYSARDEGSAQPLTSVWGVLFNAIERVRDCIDEIKDWFGISSAEDKAGLALVRSGNEVLPLYGKLIEGFFTTIVELCMPTFVPTLIGIAEAQAQCALLYQKKLTIDKPLSSSMLDIADYAYNGHSKSAADEYVKLSANELPQSIKILYDERTGLFTSSRGLKAWLGKKNDNVVVAYSGTDIKSFDMVYADIIQFSSPSTLYLKGAGLLYTLMQHMKDKKFYATGHSLGGGLSQFCATASMRAYADRLCAYGYNPAGLSAFSLIHLESARLSKAKEKTYIFSTCYDPVSMLGGKLGCLTTLPATDSNFHGIDDVKKCMAKYLKTTESTSDITMDVTLRNHTETQDFIPYTCELSAKDQNGIIYPIFNADSSSQASDFANMKISKPLFDLLGFSKTATDNCLGVYNKFNGTAHTVINRLLLMSHGAPVTTTASIGNIHSSIIYGKFGLGINEFLTSLTNYYVKSGQAFSCDQSAFELLKSELYNPFKYDKAAWCTGIWLELGVDMYVLFNRHPYAETAFDTFLTKLTNDRIDLYRSIYKNLPPTNQQKKVFITRLAAIIVSNTNKLMGEAVSAGVITNANRQLYHDMILSFANMVIAGV